MAFEQKQFTYTNNTSITIPSYAYDIYVTIAGAKGGRGSIWGSGIPYWPVPGQGRIGKFKFNTDFTTKNIQIIVGKSGGNGNTVSLSGTTTVVNTGGPGGSGNGSGGRGMYVNTTISGSGSRPGGGGGGGASSVSLNGTTIVVAGGGGGSDSNGVLASQGQDGGHAFGWSSSGSVNPSNGGDGSFDTSKSFNRQASGGGGGGAPGGIGGRHTANLAIASPDPSEGGRSVYNSSFLSLNGDLGLNNGDGYVVVEYKEFIPDPPTIASFTYSPNPQNSSNGVPNSSVTLFWTTTNSSAITIDQGVGDVTSPNGNISVNTGLQSIAGTTSPATKKYILTATGIEAQYGRPTTTRTAEVTVQVYNDNTPNNFTVPNKNNVEPNSLVIIDVGNITGIDMPTVVNGGPGVDCAVNGFNFSNNVLINNNQFLRVRAYSLGFNTSPDGLTNSIEYYVDVGTTRRYFTITTRAPNIQEIFNYPNEDDRTPFPKIDTLPENPDQYIESEPTLLVLDDVELANPYGVEVKISNPNAQVRIKEAGESGYGPWRDVRSI